MITLKWYPWSMELSFGILHIVSNMYQIATFTQPSQFEYWRILNVKILSLGLLQCNASILNNDPCNNTKEIFKAEVKKQLSQRLVPSAIQMKTFLSFHDFEPKKKEIDNVSLKKVSANHFVIQYSMILEHMIWFFSMSLLEKRLRQSLHSTLMTCQVKLQQQILLHLH